RAELSKCRSVGPARPDSGITEEARALEQRLRAVTERINRQQHDGRAPPQLLAERRMLWDRFVSAGHDESPVPVPDLDAIRAVLNDNEAVLYYYWVDRNQLLRLTLDRRRHALESVHVGTGHRQALDDLAGALTSRTDRIDKHVVDGIDDFHDVLWPADGTARAILAHADRLIVSPHRQLHALPLGALRVDGDYVIKRWSVRHVPNLAALLPRDQSGAPAGGLLTVGVTRYAIPDTPLRDLPAAADECRDVAGLYEARGWPVFPLLDDAAEEDAIAAAMRSRPAVAHFACHGQSVEADTPLESCLYLNRSVLDGLEIPLMGTAPRTVVLSACGAGQRAIAGRGMPELPGDDLLGLQAAFFAGGTQEIVAPLYPVDDKVARPICTAFHRHHLSGEPADVALAHAVREFIDNANRVTGRRYFWAPFFLTALGPNPPLAPGRIEHPGNSINTHDEYNR
ncbi:CHAT domain-containing protein, partial [Ectothiorhodospiraceae bacterium WFHF3C12]|nr:CHAT domain-containing protein [Ectothiorhodospiraceae bacterium WFHF3C12]